MARIEREIVEHECTAFCRPEESVHTTEVSVSKPTTYEQLRSWLRRDGIELIGEPVPMETDAGFAQTWLILLRDPNRDAALAAGPTTTEARDD